MTFFSSHVWVRSFKLCILIACLEFYMFIAVFTVFTHLGDHRRFNRYMIFFSSHSQCVLTEELSWWFFLWCNNTEMLIILLAFFLLCNTEMLIILLAIIVIWSCSAKIVLFLVIVFGYILILYSDMYFCSFWTEYWSAYSLTLLYWYLFISGQERVFISCAYL